MQRFLYFLSSGRRDDYQKLKVHFHHCTSGVSAIYIRQCVNTELPCTSNVSHSEDM